MSIIWTEDLVEALTAMWAAGKSGSEIAEAFGHVVSRSAVCGKVHRLKLPARAPSGAERSRKSLTQAATSISVQTKRPATVPRSTKVAVGSQGTEEPGVEITQAVGARLVPFLDIGPGECRFVVEDRPAIMCGASVHRPGEAWCPYHRRIVYVPASARNTELRRLNAFAGSATRAAPVAIANGW